MIDLILFILEPIPPAPKTYITKNKFDYFKPTVQVEMDHPEKEDTVTQIFIRGKSTIFVDYSIMICFIGHIMFSFIQ